MRTSNHNSHTVKANHILDNLMYCINVKQETHENGAYPNMHTLLSLSLVHTITYGYGVAIAICTTPLSSFITMTE
jgi:hypothetical protein